MNFIKGLPNVVPKPRLMMSPSTESNNLKLLKKEIERKKGNVLVGNVLYKRPPAQKTKGKNKNHSRARLMMSPSTESQNIKLLEKELKRKNENVLVGDGLYKRRPSRKKKSPLGIKI
jgi:hypothetical protein